MESPSDDVVYYVISDLHIGGDEQLEEVEFSDELIEFLQDLEARDEPIELIINGDAFGLWEFTGVEGPEKFDILIETYPDLFEQFRQTGAVHQITLLPGNHDHELAAYEEYVDRLADYNIDLLQEESITRPIGDQAIHFEHGNQRDPNNVIEDFGNPYARPLGYYYNTQVVSRAGHMSDRGRFNWLKDVQAVTPTERMPRWLISKYFYREMHPALRYAFVPFLLLFNISALLALVAALDIIGVWSFPVVWTTTFLGGLGLAGTAIYYLLAANIVIAGLLLLIGIPIYFILQDIKRTIERFGVFETDLTVDYERPYVAAARDVFERNSNVAIFCYGHTHRPIIRELDGGLLVNSGTWLKRLYRREVIAGVLPPVFYPSYELCAVRIERTDEGIVVNHEAVEKPNPSTDELTRIERLLTLGREPNAALPSRTVIPANEDQ